MVLKYRAQSCAVPADDRPVGRNLRESLHINGFRTDNVGSIALALLSIVLALMVKNRHRKAHLFVFCFFLANAGTATTADDQLNKVEFFEKHIRPILVDHCYDCHGPEEKSGKLRLDLKSGWERGGAGGPAIVPGDPSASLLIRAISWQDPTLQMPPEDAGGRLSDDQIAQLTSWIRDGAQDPRTGTEIITEIEAASKVHWAFQPMIRPQIPVGAHAVDFLIDRKTQELGFTATEPADMRTLVRRATFDLLGVPPTPERPAVSPEGFPNFIRQLLASPRYGERWGRHWLDVARYSDAKDGVLMYGDARIRPFAYTYRDYVIRSFNDDKPFDQFIREQIAADQLSLPESSPDLAAMGFLTLGRMFDNNRHDVIDDQIDVVTRGFLGLTVSCARCHDHKFDPVPTADYYSLYGVFASCVEPYDRPRIADVTEDNREFETEFAAKLEEVCATQDAHVESTLTTARDRTPDYLARVATTDPDIDETSIFFLSLLPNQLRPRITWRWRQLIARRAFPDDPVFAPWHDLMKDPVLRPDDWRQRGVDSRIIDGLVRARPQTAEQIARTYGRILRSVWKVEEDLKEQIAAIDSRRATLTGESISLADIVAGGNGLGTGTRGHGIHPGTGTLTSGETGFVTVESHDRLIPVPTSRFIDGVFVPSSEVATVTTTGIRVAGITPTSGQTWDYLKSGPSSGATVNTIDGVEYASAPHQMLGMHANKGITFDLQAMRSDYIFGDSHLRAILGHGGAMDQSQLDFAAYLDGRQVLEHLHVRAQQSGLVIDIRIPEAARFLTLIVTEGGQGISHDQAIFGNPQIVPNKSEEISRSRRALMADLTQRQAELQARRDALALNDDPLGSLLVSRESPVWFPTDDIYHYLSRQQKDAFRGLVNELDAISVRHSNAASRAMVVIDSEVLCDPVIFQRGDPGQRGTPVPRQFLTVLSPDGRSEFRNGSGRLNLAAAIASANNPLTARVWVNRVWMHHFGEPLVENPDDFGLRTKRPVHHELLDYLADFLVQNGWRIKPLHELIMSSHAYQRASRIPETSQMARQLNADPGNQFVWHANRRRLDFEQMRDTMLAVSGKLDDTMYGRPLLITDPENHRRTVYAFVERQNIPAMVQTFDFANADTSIARRVTTTVPQQALFAMNSDFVSEAAAALAKLDDGLTAADRVRHLYPAVLGRSPTADELDLAIEFLAVSSTEQFAQVLLMSNELMFIE
jgi:hypothetical protein